MTTLATQTQNKSNLNVTQLIDLFVDMNFAQIENKAAISQFKILAIQIGYPLDMIDQVIALGMDEYFKLLIEVDNVLGESEKLA